MLSTMLSMVVHSVVIGHEYWLLVLRFMAKAKVKVGVNVKVNFNVKDNVKVKFNVKVKV